MSIENQESRNVSFTVGPGQAGLRLDVFLSQADPAFSRSQIKYAIEEGDVLVNGREPKASQHLKAGDRVDLHWEPVMEAAAVPQDIPLNIVYEDSSVIVVNKPAGMVVHPAPGNPDQTLVNALLFHCKDLSGIGGVLRPGIVHRLDKETSGLIVAAKTDEARALHQTVAKHLRALGQTVLPIPGRSTEADCRIGLVQRNLDGMQRCTGHALENQRQARAVDHRHTDRHCRRPCRGEGRIDQTLGPG